jgi:hypothetical protein
MERTDESRPAAAAAAGAGGEEDVESFDAWASRQRRRAALDGAWKVEVTERVVHGNTIRSVASWHDNAKQPGTPLRRAQQQCSSESARSGTQQDTSSPHPPRQTARQRRSALRSAAHHKLMRLRVLRSHVLAVRFLVRLSRLLPAPSADRMLHAQLPAVKRRHSPTPEEPSMDRPADDGCAAPPPPPKRAVVGTSTWKQAISRAIFGDG